MSNALQDMPLKFTHAQRLAQSICDAVQRADIDETVLHSVERLVLDTIGCGLGATHEAPVRAARQWAAMNRSKPYATLLGTHDTSSILGAALVNCTAMRHLDLNDCDWMRNPAHPSDNIGGCLAVAEATGASSKDLLIAILIGYEVQMRSNELTKISFFRETGWDHTTILTIASACSTGALLKLDAECMAHAISIAASYPTIGELRVGQISMMKALSAGLSVTRGIEAAYLASFCATGPLTIFEGKRGMEKLVLGESDWHMFSDPIKQWRLPRTCLKQYPAAYIIHSGIDATLALLHEHKISPDAIVSVEVAGFGWLIEDMVNGMGGKSRYDIDARETADHSLPYCVAVSLVDGEYTIKQLATPRWEAEEVKRMLKKVKCVHDVTLDDGFPARRPVRVTIVLANGVTVSKQVDFPRGDPRNPMSDADLSVKFRMLACSVLAPEKLEKVNDIALNVRKHQIKELIEACKPSKTAENGDLE